MTVFGAVYTVIGYRLTEAPFSLPQGIIGSIFLVYLVGTVSASDGREAGRAARAGAARCTWRAARRRAGLLLSLADSLPLVLLGLVLITAGFFAGHAVASSSVSHTATHGRRAGLRALPVRVLHRLQRGRHARRGRLPRGRLGRDGGARPAGGARRRVDHGGRARTRRGRSGGWWPCRTEAPRVGFERTGAGQDINCSLTCTFRRSGGHCQWAAVASEVPARKDVTGRRQPQGWVGHERRHGDDDRTWTSGWRSTGSS